MINYNHLDQQNFKFECSGLEVFGQFVQKVIIPAITKLKLPVSSPPSGLKEVIYTSGGLNWDNELTVTCIVNEDMSSLIELFDWMYNDKKIIVETGKYGQQTYVWGMNPRNIDVFVLSNNKTPINKITFYDAYPTNFGGFTFDTTSTGPITTDITFSYSYYALSSLTLSYSE